MEWIEDYQLFLFDFDGLLVNTEEIHFQAYKNTCEKYGFSLEWDFPHYCRYAHYRSEGLREALTALCSKLEGEGWDAFYKMKSAEVCDLVSRGEVQLMPGVEALLTKLEGLGKQRCVVTHSSDKLVSPVREKHAILNTIPIWFTREYYRHPKPNPECYEQAIERLAGPDDRVVGFEDTPRGLQALMGTRAQAVLVSRVPYPEIEQYVGEGALHYPSFQEFK